MREGRREEELDGGELPGLRLDDEALLGTTRSNSTVAEGKVADALLAACPLTFFAPPFFFLPSAFGLSTFASSPDVGSSSSTREKTS